MLKITDRNSKSSIKVLSGMLPDSMKNKKDKTVLHPLKIRKTLLDMAKMNLDDNPKKKSNQKRSFLSPFKSSDKPKKPSFRPPKKSFFISRSSPQRSADSKIVIEVRFENIFPYLIQLGKVDIADVLIDAFNEKNVNHLNLFLMHGQEKAAL